ncbi:hypothetical protein GCK72_005805 [Caenorhabditis remanei]|uniref:Uncharacterized protein n=1 Tax=Caenorhabditis remanei TaxID=31234 RepID=A0A6A5HIP3_CAERE|nr:hypothetical protein GCK72_005805 [Caenorhabditis remanei]KAF1765852.1 hypothetical protein GCK72_005805 [Caenorhabditis remanei]
MPEILTVPEDQETAKLDAFRKYPCIPVILHGAIIVAKLVENLFGVQNAENGSLIVLNNIVGNFRGDAELSVDCRGSKMWRSNDERVIDKLSEGWWFWLEDVKGGSLSVTSIERIHKILFIDDSSTSHIDNTDSFLALGES